MAQRFSPPEEIAASLGVTAKQFQRAVRVQFRKTVAAWWEQHAATGRYLVRQKQFDKATEGEGNTQLLKWLGIQYLGQRDRVDILQKPDPNANADAAAADAEKASREKGFSILTPEGMTVIDNRPGLPRPHEEQAVVEAVIVEEQKAATEPKPGPEKEILVETYGGEK